MVVNDSFGVPSRKRGCDSSSRMLTHATVTVVTGSVSAGIAVMIADPRLGLLPAAFILGWTQLAGL